MNLKNFSKNIIFPLDKSCLGLTSITIPDSVSYIGNHSFASSGLEDVKLPEGLEKINEATFYACLNLKSVTIPDSVTSVDYWAFCYCDSLTDIYYGGDKTMWGNVSIAEFNDELLFDATIHFNAVGTAAPKIADIPTISDGMLTVNLSDVEYDSVLIAAVYSDGILKDIQTAGLSAGDTSKKIAVSANNADTAKIFIWDSLESMNPLCEAENIDI